MMRDHLMGYPPAGDPERMLRLNDWRINWPLGITLRERQQWAAEAAAAEPPRKPFFAALWDCTTTADDIGIHQQRAAAYAKAQAYADANGLTITNRRVFNDGLVTVEVPE